MPSPDDPRLRGLPARASPALAELARLLLLMHAARTQGSPGAGPPPYHLAAADPPALDNFKSMNAPVQSILANDVTLNPSLTPPTPALDTPSAASHPTIDSSPPVVRHRMRQEHHSTSHDLVVLDLSPDVTELVLYDFFKSVADVRRRDVSIVVDRTTHLSRGFGYVTVAGSSQARWCIQELSGMYLRGRRVTVDFSSTHRRRDLGPARFMGNRRETLKEHAEERRVRLGRLSSNGSSSQPGRSRETSAPNYHVHLNF